MKKYQIIIESAGSKILIRSDNKIFIDGIKKSSFLPRYIPGFSIIEKAKKNDCILDLKKGKKSFFLNYPRAIYSNSKYDDKDTISLIEFFLERAREDRGTYCIHSSSAIVEKKGVVFWGGWSGMGKTRLALALGEKYGADTYSDEKTLLDLKKNLIVGGINTAYLSKSSLIDSHEGRSFHEFSKLEGNFSIGFFVSPQIEETGELFVEKWDNNKFDWHLYEELSRKIRGTSRRFFSNTTPVDSLDSSATAQKRSNIIKRYTKITPCFYMRGREEDICNKIVELLRGLNS
ncbi:MAG: hypothetical protein UT05_C0013G0020 [Parcubacteria group bacterium GW2011_GWF2_38_76]|nr:MAG: hypothetical protein UT05_C0013G0020 [Parcubacteria group bacterium GW2011_GWF2_38_76]HBM45388.1 hypothetical protein [Patescibacteria group bacterium]